MKYRISLLSLLAHTLLATEGEEPGYFFTEALRNGQPSVDTRFFYFIGLCLFVLSISNDVLTNNGIDI